MAHFSRERLQENENAGANSIKKLIESEQYKRVALIGETFDQIRTVMVEKQILDY